MAKILITGSSGFIGSHLAETMLAGNHEITCLVRRSSHTDRLRSPDLRLVYGDITDRDSLLPAFRGQDTVFHLAACLRAIDAEQFYQINEQGAHNTAWACAQQTTPPVLVLVSSLSAMGPSVNGRPRHESDPPAPVSNYGRSKQAAEQAVWAWADRVPITIVRPPVVFGEADLTCKNIFTSIYRYGVHLLPTWRTHRLSLVHVDDLVQLLILASRQGKRLAEKSTDSTSPDQGCYFAACEQDPTYADFGRMIGDALGRRRIWVLRTGPLIVWSTACFATMLSRVRGQPLYFDMERARDARAGSWTCSADVANRELGFAVAAPLLQRLRQTSQWYLENGWL